MSHSRVRDQLLTGHGHSQVTLVKLLVFAGLLRIAAFSMPVWGDEQVALHFISSYGPVELLTAIPANQPHFPAFYVLIRLWGDLTGMPYASGRLISVVAGTALVGLTYWMGREYAGERAGLGAALLLAASPPVLLAAGWLRMYALLGLASAGAAWAVIRIRAGDTGAWRLWSLATTGAVLLHPYGLFITPLGALAALKHRPRARELLPVGAATGIGVFTLATKLLAPSGNPTSLKHLATPPTVPEIVLAPIAMLTGRLMTPIQVPLAIAVAVGAGWAVWRYRSEETAVLLAWVLLPVAGAAAVSHLLSPIFQLKYLLLAAPAVAILSGRSLATLEERQWKLAVGALVVSQLLAMAFVPPPPHIALRVIP